MDHQQFDQLARALAGGGSRRTVVRGLLGSAAGWLGLVRAGRVGAQTSAVPLGGACTDSAQCSQTVCGVAASVICGDNGLPDDGALTCCVGGGSYCTTDSDCCGALYCIGVTDQLCGTCQNQNPSQGTGTATQTPDQGTTAGGDLPLGAACTSTTECSQAGGPTVCADNRIATDGALNCCRADGGACTADSDCCQSSVCTNGVCGAQSGGSRDQPLGAVCTSSDQCSQDAGAAVCADNGVTDDGTLNCCLLEAVGCTQDSDCCAGLVCGDNGIAEDGSLTCCGMQGSQCGSDAACCNDLFCLSGTCQPLA